MTNKHKFLLLSVIIFIVCGIFCYNYFYSNSEVRSALKSVSQINMNGIERQVATKIKKLQEEVKNNSRSATPWGKLAMNLDAHDFQNESLKAYRVAAKLDPNDFRWPYFEGIVLSQIGAPEALESFEAASKIKSDYVPLLVREGDLLNRFGNEEQAVQKYRQALLFDSKSAHAHFGLARILFAKGDMNASRNELNQILQDNPQFGEAYSLLVSVCRSLKDDECVERALEAGKNVPTKNDLVDPVYTELIAEGESSIWYRFRGTDYFRRGMYDAAISEFQKTLSLRPDAQSHEDLAKTFSAAGRFPEAVQHYRSALATHPTANNYFGLALILARTGQYAEAQSMFEKTIELNPNFAEAYFNLAVLFAKKRELQKTLENLQQAIRLKQDYAEAHFYLAQTYLAMNHREAAMQEYKILSNLDRNLANRLKILMN